MHTFCRLLTCYHMDIEAQRSGLHSPEIMAPILKDPRASPFPIATRWGNSRVLRGRRHPPGTTTRSLLSGLTEVTWRSFQHLRFPDLVEVARARHLIENRVLFRGIWGHAWYLGERVTPQWPDFDMHFPPCLPPSTMDHPERIPMDQIERLAEGTWDDSFLDQNRDYETFLEEVTVCTPFGPRGPVVCFPFLNLLQFPFCLALIDVLAIEDTTCGPFFYSVTSRGC
ncbi:uncharacterized protein LOC122080051 isoform X2 [Macadamia integrifolia]|uniref:uncharacterized protein LOC122080051 isoform X2 n=1 Tax=Macadamia integrifolia TaxID=60698 RepID=UPI001C4E9CBC|nr:uncharacterized protein LOC122080051 isoform X2 [Macadamia integrifolia]